MSKRKVINSSVLTHHARIVWKLLSPTLCKKQNRRYKRKLILDENQESKRVGIYLSESSVIEEEIKYRIVRGYAD